MPGVLRAEVVRPDPRQAGGAGALREIVLPLLKLTELVEVYEPPTFMRYRIIGSIPPLRHEHGFMTFAEEPGGTRVRWHPEFEVVSSVLSGTLTALMNRSCARGFGWALSRPDFAWNLVELCNLNWTRRPLRRRELSL